MVEREGGNDGLCLSDGASRRPQSIIQFSTAFPDGSCDSKLGCFHHHRWRVAVIEIVTCVTIPNSSRRLNPLAPSFVPEMAHAK